MKLKELYELQRSSLLALKAYYVQSLNADMVASGNLFQVEAAARLNEAATRLIQQAELGDHLSNYAREVVDNVLADLVDFRKDLEFDPPVLEEMQKELEQLVKADDGDELNTDDLQEGGEG